VDFQKSAAVLYFSLIIALTTGYFFVVVFNENWIFSTLTYALCITVLMYRIGMELLGEEDYELAIKAVYSTFIYAVIAYLGEIRGK
jgi:presenilin-like A22 family membrane protease